MLAPPDTRGLSRRDAIVAACIVLLGLLAGCRTQPSAEVSTGDVLLRESFEQSLGWTGGARDNVVAGVADGAYRLRGDVNAYVRGFYRTYYDDIVIEVDGVQLSEHQVNAYGVICRATPDQDRIDGYYFLISGDGAFSIRKGQHGVIDALIPWRRSDAINRGTALNRLRVVCAEDYLALTVNGQFVADVRDSTYSRGVPGFALATQTGSITEVAFDNLIVLAASLAD